MDRCWLQGALGDVLHCLSCAAGYKLRWLLQAIARLGMGAVFAANIGNICKKTKAADRPSQVITGREE